jgi:hypothetical protein
MTARQCFVALPGEHVDRSAKVWELRGELALGRQVAIGDTCFAQ